MAQRKATARRAVDGKLGELNARFQDAFNAVRCAAIGADLPTFGRVTWGQALEAIHALERATKRVRAVVRARDTKDRREACGHPEDRRHTYLGGSSRCRACGLNFKAPAEVKPC